MPDYNAGNISGSPAPQPFLTNYSVNWLNAQTGTVAISGASLIPVDLQSADYTVFDRGSLLRDQMELRPLGGRPVQAGYTAGSEGYFAREYALEHPIDDRQRRKYPADRQLNLDRNATQFLTRQSLIKRDVTWSKTFFQTGVWSFDVQGVNTGPSDGQFLQLDQAGSDPIGTIDRYLDAMEEATGYRPNTIVAGTAVKRALRTQADITDRIKYTQRGIADEDLLAQVLLGENNDGRFITARSVQNAAKEGLPNQFQYIVPPTGMWLGYIERNVGVESPTAIGLFAWQGLLPGMSNEQGGVIERGREELAHSDIFQCRDAWDMKVIAPDLGAFFSDVVSSNA